MKTQKVRFYKQHRSIVGTLIEINDQLAIDAKSYVINGGTIYDMMLYNINSRYYHIIPKEELHGMVYSMYIPIEFETVIDYKSYLKEERK